MRTQLVGAVGAFALAASTLVAPAVSNADDCVTVPERPFSPTCCGDNTFWDSGLQQCVMEGPGFADPTGPVQSGEQLDPTGSVQSSEHLIPCAAATGFTSTPEPGEPCG